MAKECIRRARRFANVLRFIDGLTALNDGGEMELNFKDIYLPEPVLKMENLGNDDESF